MRLSNNVDRRIMTTSVYRYTSNSDCEALWIPTRCSLRHCCWRRTRRNMPSSSNSLYYLIQSNIDVLHETEDCIIQRTDEHRRYMRLSNARRKRRLHVGGILDGLRMFGPPFPGVANPSFHSEGKPNPYPSVRVADFGSGEN